MTNPFDLPSVIKCPSCGRTNGVPTRGGSFDCMFCGARIDLPAAASNVDFVQPPSTPLSTPMWTPLERPAAPSALPPPAASRPLDRSYTPAPAFDPGSGEVASYRWYSGKAVFDVIVSAATAAFFLWIFLATTDVDSLAEIPWLFVLFGATFVLSALSSLYKGLARIFNTSSLRLQNGVLSARHQPIPWSGAKVDVDAIDRIVVYQSRVQQNRRSSTVRYDLVAYRTDGRKVVLIPSLNSAQDGERIQAQLSQHLSLRK